MVSIVRVEPDPVWFNVSAAVTVTLPSSVIAPPVTFRFEGGVVPPTTPSNVTAPVPAFTVRPWVPAVVASTVLVKSTAVLVLLTVVVLPSVTAP